MSAFKIGLMVWLVLDHGQDHSSDPLKFVRFLCGQIALLCRTGIGIDHMEHREPLLNLPCMCDRLGLFLGDGKLPVEGTDGGKRVVQPRLRGYFEPPLAVLTLVNDFPQDVGEFIQGSAGDVLET